MNLASTGVINDQWLIDELEDHALGRNDTDSDEISVSDDWEYVDWTMVVTPRIVKPDGRLIVDEVDHTDIETIVIPEGTPCATYRIRFIAGNGGFGIAEIDDILAPPAENDTFRLGIDTTTSHEIVANEPLIQSFKSGLKSDIRVTIELEIVEQNGVVGCRLVNPGMAPFEGAVMPATGTDDGTKATVDHTHVHLPESVVDPRIYQLEIEGSPSADQFFVEILDSQTTPVRAQVVDQSLDEQSVFVSSTNSSVAHS